jgi:hypothetical protein
MAPPSNNSIITRTIPLTLYDQNHMLIIKYANSIDFWVRVPYGTLTWEYAQITGTRQYINKNPTVFLDIHVGLPNVFSVA